MFSDVFRGYDIGKLKRNELKNLIGRDINL